MPAAGFPVPFNPEQELADSIEKAIRQLWPQVSHLIGNGGPTIGGDWFTGPIYRPMLGLGLGLLVPLILMNLLVSWRRGSLSMVWETAWHTLAAVMVAQFAVWVTVALEGFADALSLAMMGALVGGNVTALLNHLGAMTAVTGGAAPLVVIVLGGLIVAALLILLVEMFMRMVGVYLCLAFIPLAAAGLTNPWTNAWLHKVISVEVVLIMLKPAIVILLCIGATMFTASPISAGPQGDPGVVAMLGGLVVVGLTALTPMALMRFVPFMEGHAAHALSAKTHSVATMPIRHGSRQASRVGGMVKGHAMKGLASKGAGAASKGATAGGSAGMAAAAPPVLAAQAATKAAKVMVRRGGDVGRLVDHSKQQASMSMLKVRRSGAASRRKK